VIDQLDDVVQRELRQGDVVLRRVESHLALSECGAHGDELISLDIRLGRVQVERGEVVVVGVDVEVLGHLTGARAERAGDVRLQKWPVLSMR
jgi:hypothetical protein